VAHQNDPVPSSSNTETNGSGKLMKKPFHKLFNRGELIYYCIAAVIYISLGVIFLNPILNFVIGPLFIVLWIWWVPVLVDKWKARKP
jgi:hypothetical protein